MSETTEEQNAMVPVQETAVLNGEIVDDDNLRREYVSKIGTSWQKSIDAIFETGFLLIEARERLPHGGFQNMIYSELPFNDATARKLIKIAEDQRLLELARSAKALPAPEGQASRYEYFNVMPQNVLPASWGTLYELTQLTDDQFKFALEAGKIHSHLERKDAIKLKSLPTGRADMNVRGVKQPPRKDKPETETEREKPLRALNMVVLPAEALILEQLYRSAVEFGRVHEWVAQNWPKDGDSPLPAMKPLDIGGLKAKLSDIVAELGL